MTMTVRSMVASFIVGIPGAFQCVELAWFADDGIGIAGLNPKP